MAYGTGLASFIGEVPEYEVRDGRMHVSLGDFRLVMPLCVFEQGARRAQEAIQKWRAEHHGTVVQFPAAEH